jgi:hypothetical protein
MGLARDCKFVGTAAAAGFRFSRLIKEAGSLGGSILPCPPR